MHVPGIAWFSFVVVGIFVVWISIWVTNKAYSRKWEDESDEKKGEF